MDQTQTIDVAPVESSFDDTGADQELIIPPLPDREARKKKLLQVSISHELYHVTLRTVKERGLHLRHAVEWGMECFLLNAAPDVAASLGIDKATEQQMPL